MSFRVVLKSVTLNDLERRNGSYFASFQRICIRCCRTTLVDPRRHCGRHLGRFYTYHELELSTAVTPLVSLQWNSLPADITNAASLTAFIETASKHFYFTVLYLAAQLTSSAVKRL